MAAGTHYWAVIHREHGWLVDTGVGGTYSVDFETAQWFRDPLEAYETLIATDLTPHDSLGVVGSRLTQAGAFTIVQIA